MKQTFTYKDKMSFSYFYPVIAFALIAGACAYFQYGIAFKNLRLLAYPNSVYVTGGLAALFLVSALIKWNKAKQSQSNPNPITLDETSFSFPHKADLVTVKYADITATRTANDEDDGNSVVVTAGGKDYEFFEERFEDAGKYVQFVEAIEKNRPK